MMTPGSGECRSEPDYNGGSSYNTYYAKNVYTSLLYNRVVQPFSKEGHFKSKIIDGEPLFTNQNFSFSLAP